MIIPDSECEPSTTRSPCCAPARQRAGRSNETANGSIVIDSELGGVIEDQSYFIREERGVGREESGADVTQSG
jgi:hypothetical protein